MDGQGLPQPPPLAQNDPQGFYYWYVSQGFPPQMAQELTIQRFGPPKTAEERAREQARAQENYGFAKLGGQLLGSAGGIYAAGKLAGIGGGAAAGTGAAAGSFARCFWVPRHWCRLCFLRHSSSYPA